jgi:hypothetical protein
MRNRAFKLVLLAMAAAGGVVAWQRRNETPPLPPYPLPERQRAAEPFMRPSGGPADAPGADEPGESVHGGPAEEAGVVVDARTAEEGEDAEDGSDDGDRA